MSGPRGFSALRPLYKPLPEAQGGNGLILINQQTDERIAPDFDRGFYRPINEQGDFVGPPIAPEEGTQMAMVQSATLKHRKLAAHAFIWVFLALIIFPLLMVIAISVRTGNFRSAKSIRQTPPWTTGSWRFVCQ